MRVDVIKFRFNSPLHIGRGAAELDKTASLYHSDALKSAIYSAGLPYFPHWKKDADVFFNGFQISSAFPFCDQELFFPKPSYHLQFDFAETAEEKRGKKAKKVSFISAKVFQKWAQNPTEPVLVKESQVSPGGNYLFSPALKSKAFLHAEIQQRVQVPAEGDEENDSRPFYFERLYFEENSGLYFLAKFQNTTIREDVLHTIRILGMQGIGTDRTVGNGLFDFNETSDIDSLELPNNIGGKSKMNLGLYLPSKDELEAINLDESSWQIIKRGGYIGGSSFEKFMSLRKNNIFFFSEGSVFKTDQSLKGRYANLQPHYNDADLHPVYRCGQPLFITI